MLKINLVSFANKSIFFLIWISVDGVSLNLLFIYDDNNNILFSLFVCEVVLVTVQAIAIAPHAPLYYATGWTPLIQLSFFIQYLDIIFFNDHLH